MPKRKKSPEYSDSGSDYDSSDSSAYDSSGYSSSYYSSSSRSPSPVKKKRQPTEYQKFCAKERLKIKKEHPNWKLPQMSKELGKRWRRKQKK